MSRRPTFARCTSRRTSFVALLAIACLAEAGAAAAAPSISARLEPAEIQLGQDARLVVTVSDAASAPSPRVPPVDGLQVQNLGQTMSMQFVNGTMATEVTHTFLVRPARAGKFRIPTMSLQIGGDTVSTRPVTLSVVEAGRVPRVKRGPPIAGGRPSTADPSKDARSDVALLEITGLPDRKLFVGEILPVEIRLYVRQGTRVSEATPPTMVGSGFTLVRPSEDEPEQQRVRLEGAVYTRLTFPGAISPITVGEIPLSASIELTAQIPKRVPRQRRRFDDPFVNSFFDSFAYRAVDQKIPVESPPISVDVAPLPEEGRPASFSGGIGRFTIEADAEPTRVAVGDPITLSLAVAGEGNFDRLRFPEFAESESWKTYDPTSSFEPADELGLSGRKTFEQALLPLRADRTEVPPLELSYFDPERRRYVTLTSPAIPIAVASAPVRHGPRAVGVSPGAGLDGYELAPNKIKLGTVYASLRPAATRLWFLALQALPIAALCGVVWLGRRRRRLARDPFHLRDRKVRGELRVLGQRMDAAVAAGDAAGFFDSARRALQERVAGIDGGVAAQSLTPPEIERRLAHQPQLRERVREVFAAADALAYGGQGESPGDLARLRAEVASILEDLSAGANS